jgi:hypothetical protein
VKQPEKAKIVASWLAQRLSRIDLLQNVC